MQREKMQLKFMIGDRASHALCREGGGSRYQISASRQKTTGNRQRRCGEASTLSVDQRKLNQLPAIVIQYHICGKVGPWALGSEQRSPVPSHQRTLAATNTVKIIPLTFKKSEATGAELFTHLL